MELKTIDRLVANHRLCQPDLMALIAPKFPHKQTAVLSFLEFCEFENHLDFEWEPLVDLIGSMHQPVNSICIWRERLAPKSSIRLNDAVQILRKFSTRDVPYMTKALTLN
jgi:hypothetical protein